MDSKKVNKAKFDNKWYRPGTLWKRTLWYFVNVIIFLNPLFPFRRIKPSILRLFGAKVGKHCLVKPGVNIKYPWFLKIGDYVSIGENVWIDNLGMVVLGDQVTISQGAILITGNHDYTSSAFDLMVGNIKIEYGAWISAKAQIGPNVIIHEQAVVGLGAVVTKDCKANGIYYGNPATLIKERRITH
jgi:putative colanic acid biosynthesis acetyltransferase WcaF